MKAYQQKIIRLSDIEPEFICSACGQTRRGTATKNSPRSAWALVEFAHL
jgi:hypothetical protein